MSTTTTPPSQRKSDGLRSILPGRPKPVTPGPSAAGALSSSPQDSHLCNPGALTLNSTVDSTIPQSAITSILALSSKLATLSVPAVVLSTATTDPSTNVLLHAAQAELLHAKKGKNIDYPVVFFDRHALRATRGPSRSLFSLLASINKLLDADASKLAALVRLRLTKNAFMHQTTRFEVTELMTRDYLLWTTFYV